MIVIHLRKGDANPNCKVGLHEMVMGVFTKAVANSAAGKPSIDVDVEECLQMLEDLDAPISEKLELLSIIDAVAGMFVDMGLRKRKSVPRPMRRKPKMLKSKLMRF